MLLNYNPLQLLLFVLVLVNWVNSKLIDEIAETTGVMVVTRQIARVFPLGSDQSQQLELPTCHIWGNGIVDFDVDAGSRKMAVLSRSENTGINKLRIVDFSNADTGVEITFAKNSSNKQGDFSQDRVRFRPDDKAQKGNAFFMWSTKEIARPREKLNALQVLCLVKSVDTTYEILKQVSSLAHRDTEREAICKSWSTTVMSQHGESIRRLHDMAAGGDKGQSLAATVVYSVQSTQLLRLLVNSTATEETIQVGATKWTEVAVDTDSQTGYFWVAWVLHNKALAVARIENNRLYETSIIKVPLWASVSNVVRLSIHGNIGCISFRQGKNKLDAFGIVKLDLGNQTMAAAYEIDNLIGAMCLPRAITDELNTFGDQTSLIHTNSPAPAKPIEKEIVVEPVGLLWILVAAGTSFIIGITLGIGIAFTRSSSRQPVSVVIHQAKDF